MAYQTGRPGKKGKKKVIRTKGGAMGGSKLPQSGGPRMPVEEVTVAKKKTPRLKPKAYTTGGGTKLGATVVKGKVKKY